MPYPRIAAAAVAVLLMAGCGPASGQAPSATSRTAAPATASSPNKAAKSPAPSPATASTPAAPSAKRLQAPKEVTLADNGLIVDLKVDDAFTLRLPAPKGWRWKVTGFDSAVLAKRSGPTGTLGAFRAVKAGFSMLTAEEIPPCGSRCPSNARGPVFNVAVRVAP